MREYPFERAIFERENFEREIFEREILLCVYDEAAERAKKSNLSAEKFLKHMR